MKKPTVILLIAFVVMFMLHQDVWWWTDDTLVFGFLPISMAYHIFFSFVTAAFWWAATKWAWPAKLESWADAGSEGGAR